MVKIIVKKIINRLRLYVNSYIYPLLQPLVFYYVTKNKSEDIFFLIQTNIGETFVFANAFSDITLNYYVFIFTKKQQLEIFKMFNKDFKYILTTNRIIRNPKKNKYKVNRKSIIVLMGKDFWNKLYKTKNHFITELKKYDVIFSNITLKSPKFLVKNNYELNSHEEKDKKIILLFPESSSQKSLSKHFWESIGKCLELKGYTVVCNVSNEENIIDSLNCINISIYDLLEIAQYSHHIIGLRSGILEIIASYGCNIEAVYTESWIQNIYHNYSFEKYIFENKGFICEHIEEDETKLLTYILNKF